MGQGFHLATVAGWSGVYSHTMQGECGGEDAMSNFAVDVALFVSHQRWVEIFPEFEVEGRM